MQAIKFEDGNGSRCWISFIKNKLLLQINTSSGQQIEYCKIIETTKELNSIEQKMQILKKKHNQKIKECINLNLNLSNKTQFQSQYQSEKIKFSSISFYQVLDELTKKQTQIQVEVKQSDISYLKIDQLDQLNKQMEYLNLEQQKQQKIKDQCQKKIKMIAKNREQLKIKKNHLQQSFRSHSVISNSDDKKNSFNFLSQNNQNERKDVQKNFQTQKQNPQSIKNQQKQQSFQDQIHNQFYKQGDQVLSSIQDQDPYQQTIRNTTVKWVSQNSGYGPQYQFTQILSKKQIKSDKKNHINKLKLFTQYLKPLKTSNFQYNNQIGDRQKIKNDQWILFGQKNFLKKINSPFYKNLCKFSWKNVIQLMFNGCSINDNGLTVLVDEVLNNKKFPHLQLLNLENNLLENLTKNLNRFIMQSFYCQDNKLTDIIQTNQQISHRKDYYRLHG